MTAAAEAVREGGATVLVLEQQDIIGGETLYEPVLTLSDGTLTSGYGMLGDLRAEVEEAGAELLTGVKLTGLEVTDGRVTGVRAESADTDYLIHAQYGVILATGDYGGNPELVLAGAGETGLAEGLQEHFRTLSRGSSDGSGLTAALEAGAAASGLGQLEIWDSAPEQRRLGESRELLCVAVSYTHLDVYKRQEPISKVLVRDKNGYYPTEFGDRRALELGIRRKRYLIPPTQYEDGREDAPTLLRRAMADYRRGEAELPGLVNGIFLGDRVQFDTGREWLVIRVQWKQNGSTAHTHLELADPTYACLLYTSSSPCPNCPRRLPVPRRWNSPPRGSSPTPGHCRRRRPAGCRFSPSCWGICRLIRLPLLTPTL